MQGGGARGLWGRGWWTCLLSTDPELGRQTGTLLGRSSLVLDGGRWGGGEGSLVQDKGRESRRAWKGDFPGQQRAVRRWGEPQGLRGVFWWRYGISVAREGASGRPWRAGSLLRPHRAGDATQGRLAGGLLFPLHVDHKRGPSPGHSRSRNGTAAPDADPFRPSPPRTPSSLPARLVSCVPSPLFPLRVSSVPPAQSVAPGRRRT